MDVFSSEALRAGHRFRPPRVEKIHYVEVLFPSGDAFYFDGTDLTPARDDALEFHDVYQAFATCQKFTREGLEASVETFQRIAR